MNSRPVVSLVATLIAVLFVVACGGASATARGPGPAPASAAATNTSIAAARPVSAGDVIDLVLPCTGKVYFGPIRFAAENQRLAIVSSVRSLSGAQVCGGGAFVDESDVQQAVAGTGCIEDSHGYETTLEYVFAPGAGNSPANPIYLSLWSLDGAGGPVGESCAQLGLRLAVREAP